MQFSTVHCVIIKLFNCGSNLSKLIPKSCNENVFVIIDCALRDSQKFTGSFCLTIDIKMQTDIIIYIRHHVIVTSNNSAYTLTLNTSTIKTFSEYLPIKRSQYVNGILPNNPFLRVVNMDTFHTLD